MTTAGGNSVRPSAARPKGVYAQTLDVVGLKLVEGAVAPGTVLDPEGLERQLGVSRTVVREVLRVLGTKGLVAARPRSGTIVQPRSNWGLLDPDILRWQFESNHGGTFLDDLMELRELVEPGVAVLAARHRSNEDVALLEEALAEMATAGRDGERFIVADIGFHRAMLRATQNELLFKLHEVVDIGLLARHRFVEGVREWSTAVPEHGAVLAAIRSADPDGAKAAVEALLLRGKNDVALARELRGESEKGRT